MKSPITTHILDTTLGKPASGVPVLLEYLQDDDWQHLANSETDDDGRISNLLDADKAIEAGIYRITFDTASYFQAAARKTFYPYVSIVFEINQTDQHYHVPLLLNPFGYSTYRGS